MRSKFLTTSLLGEESVPAGVLVVVSKLSVPSANIIIVDSVAGS